MLVISQPTTPASPDPDLGGLAVTGVANGGHASTVTSCSGAGGNQEKSARWTAFQAVGGRITAITLKIDHTSSGSLTGGSSNSLLLEYSLNAGASWSTALSRSNFTAAQGPTTFSVALSASQAISDVRVRVDYLCDSNDAGDAASITATIANIKLEANVIVEPNPVFIS